MVRPDFRQLSPPSPVVPTGSAPAYGGETRLGARILAIWSESSNSGHFGPRIAEAHEVLAILAKMGQIRGLGPTVQDSIRFSESRVQARSGFAVLCKSIAEGDRKRPYGKGFLNFRDF